MLTLYKEKEKLKKFSQGRKQQYLTKKYANPYFADRKTIVPKINPWPYFFKFPRLYLSFLFILLISVVLFLFYSPYFYIAEINAQGGGQIDKDAFTATAWELTNDNFFIFVPQKNIFFFSKSRLSAALNKKFPLAELKIDKKLPRTINITYQEKQLAFIWQEDGKFYKTSDQGSIISEVNVLDIKNDEWPLIENQSNNKIINQSISFDSDHLSYVLKLYTALKEYFIEISFTKILIDNELNTIKIITAGPQLYFSTKEDINKQITKLITVRRNKFKDNYLKKEYIDLRYGDSIYSY